MIIDLTDTIKLLRPQPRASFPYSNSIFIDDDIKTVIDAGAGGRVYSEIPTSAVERICLSHYHFDHTHSLGYFRSAVVMAGVEEALVYSSPEAYFDFSGFARWEMLMGQPKRQLFSGGSNLPPDVPEKPGFRPISLHSVFSDGDIISCGKTKIETVHIPGHTNGHYGFWFEKEGILFTADIDLSPGGPWYGEEYSDFDQVITSVQRIMELKPEILVTSHRRVFKRNNDNVDALLRDYLAVALQREEDILSFLDQPRTIDDIAQQGLVYDPAPRTEHLVFWNKMMILKHLQRLKKWGQVIQPDDYHFIRTGV
ncbi:MBL fold metallo-hydrolase [Syntrophomonas palmitatica]|uniref:MBL fold metallo-hydrolase n=1 Tax=Syntrophomonas palmitatica TaxID=402877 RepID=UPI0006D156AB|nr:MBL fold metallo-hydrolase [Syntrophomonas palmitatica]